MTSEQVEMAEQALEALAAVKEQPPLTAPYMRLRAFVLLAKAECVLADLGAA